MREQDASHMAKNARVQLKLCATPRPLFKGNISAAHYISLYIYSTQRIENDVSARLPNITSASCDLNIDLLTPDVERSCHCPGRRFMPICIKIGSLVFEV